VVETYCVNFHVVGFPDASRVSTMISHDSHQYRTDCCGLVVRIAGESSQIQMLSMLGTSLQVD